MKDTLVCLMAGGISKRLWPITTSFMPKQFIDMNKLFNENATGSMFLDTLRRNSFAENLFIMTNYKYKPYVISDLAKFSSESKRIIIGLETKNYNTGICAIVGSIVAKKLGLNSVILLPIDHIIKNLSNYKEDIFSAVRFSKDKMILIGIKPSYFTKEYGYIEVEDKDISCSSNYDLEHSLFKIKSFIEKPQNQKNYMDFYWNSGIYIFDPDTFINFVKDKSEFIKISDKLKSLNIFNEINELDLDFGELNFNSIDIEVTQKIRDIFMIKSNFDWIDIGTYEFIWNNCTKSLNNNVIVNTLNCNLDGVTNSYISLKENTFLSKIDNSIIIDSFSGQLIKTLKSKC